VLSDLLRPATEVASACAHLHQAGHQVALVQILDRAELDPPFTGVVEVAELETGRRAVVEVDGMRAEYASAVRNHLDELARGASAVNGSHHLVECGADIERAVRQIVERL
jgi:pyridoxine 5'-phosphate synthase PdxJ